MYMWVLPCISSFFCKTMHVHMLQYVHVMYIFNTAFFSLIIYEHSNKAIISLQHQFLWVY